MSELNIKESDSDYRVVCKLVHYKIRSWITRFNKSFRWLGSTHAMIFLTNIILLCILFEVSK